MSASVMLLVGAGILAALALLRSTGARLPAVVAAAATVVMMLGYGEVIRRSGEIFQTTC